MDMLIFEKNEGYKKTRNSKVVRISEDAYDKILSIARVADLSARDVADRFVAYAFEHIEWRNDGRKIGKK